MHITVTLPHLTTFLLFLLLQFKALIEGGSNPVHFSKDLYIGTVPMSRKEMKSCIAGMYNQPYAESLDDLNHDAMVYKHDSQLSLTQIIAAASTIEPRTSPTAPCLTDSADMLVSSSPSGDDMQMCNGYGRPPPFAPGHGEDQIDSPLLKTPTKEEAVPSAPTTNTLGKKWSRDSSENDNIGTVLHLH